MRCYERCLEGRKGDTRVAIGAMDVMVPARTFISSECDCPYHNEND